VPLFQTAGTFTGNSQSFFIESVVNFVNQKTNDDKFANLELLVPVISAKNISPLRLAIAPIILKSELRHNYMAFLHKSLLEETVPFTLQEGAFNMLRLMLETQSSKDEKPETFALCFTELLLLLPDKDQKEVTTILSDLSKKVIAPKPIDSLNVDLPLDSLDNISEIVKRITKVFSEMPHNFLEETIDRCAEIPYSFPIALFMLYLLPNKNKKVTQTLANAFEKITKAEAIRILCELIHNAISNGIEFEFEQEELQKVYNGIVKNLTETNPRGLKQEANYLIVLLSKHGSTFQHSNEENGDIVMLSKGVLNLIGQDLLKEANSVLEYLIEIGGKKELFSKPNEIIEIMKTTYLNKNYPLFKKIYENENGKIAETLSSIENIKSEDIISMRNYLVGLVKKIVPLKEWFDLMSEFLEIIQNEEEKKAFESELLSICLSLMKEPIDYFETVQTVMSKLIQ